MGGSLPHHEDFLFSYKKIKKLDLQRPPCSFLPEELQVILSAQTHFDPCTCLLTYPGQTPPADCVLCVRSYPPELGAVIFTSSNEVKKGDLSLNVFALALSPWITAMQNRYLFIPCCCYTIFTLLCILSERLSHKDGTSHPFLNSSTNHSPFSEAEGDFHLSKSDNLVS